MIGDGWPTVMAYTSGTTGRPKGVAIGADDFRRRAEGVAAGGARWGLGPDDVHLAVGPLYHSGPSYWAQMHLALGATVVVMVRWDAEQALAIIERDRVTSTHMVPANFQRILALPEATRDRYDLSSLKLVLHAAAPCPVPLKRAFMDFVGADKVWEYYGASEGGGTVISPAEWLEHPGSVGKPFPGNEFVILDDDGERAAGRGGRHRVGQPGRVELRVPQRRRRRPRRRIGTASSRWATRATSTRTGTSTSRTARATW